LRTAGSDGRSGTSSGVKESKRRPGTGRNCACAGSTWAPAYHERVPSETQSAPVLQLLDWISLRPRTYAETLETWHTHCPRLPVWEDALAAGLVEVRRNGADGSVVALTSAGASALRATQT